MRFFYFLFFILVFFSLVFCTCAGGGQPLAVMPSSAMIPSAKKRASALQASFFGDGMADPADYPYRTSPFGALRLWDSGTYWFSLETARGTYDWSTLDAWLSAVGNKNSQDIMIDMAGTPMWASSDPGDTTCAGSYGGQTGCNDPPSDVDSGDNMWKEFVTALVRHSLASATGHIRYYELWNEPNNSQYWNGTMGQLVTMARDAYAIVHSLDPNARVVSPCATHDASTWLSVYFAAGGAGAQDIIAYHPYPTTAGADPETTLSWIDNINSLLHSYSLTMPVWATESDWGNIKTLTNDQEEAWLAKEYILFAYKGLQRNYWYQWDNGSYSCNAAWGNLWYPGYGTCPAGNAYGQVYSWLVGSTLASPFCSKGADSTWTCNLVLANGETAQILWNSTTSESVAVPSGFTSYRTLDSNASYTISGGNVLIGNKPIMIIKN